MIDTYTDRDGNTVHAYTLEACQSCYLDAHGALEDRHGFDSEPLALIDLEAIARLEPGCLDCPPCDHPDCNHAPVCECGYGDRGHGFSWSACQACGSRLGGDRYPLTVFLLPVKPIALTPDQIAVIEEATR